MGRLENKIVAIPGTFSAVNKWSVINPSLDQTIQTSNYEIVFDGIYAGNCHAKCVYFNIRLFKRLLANQPFK